MLSPGSAATRTPSTSIVTASGRSLCSFRNIETPMVEIIERRRQRAICNRIREHACVIRRQRHARMA